MTSIQKAEAVPTHAELVDRATALQPLLRAHAPIGDISRQLGDDVITALSGAGFFRLRTPRRFGGYSADLRTLLEVTEVLGAADGSAAWLIAIAATATWTTSLGSARAQQEILGSDPDTRLSGSGHPTLARRVDGGLVIGGRWPYASGSPHATWAMLGAFVADETGEPQDTYLCLVPATDLRLEDTWHVVGMRATGSNTWVAEDLFVPEHRLISMADVTDPADMAPGLPPTVPFAPVATLALLGPLLGIGQAVLSAVVAGAGKSMHHTVFAQQRHSVGVQVQVAKAALTLRTARLSAYDIADTLDAAANSNTALDYRDRAQLRGAFGYAAQQVLKAIDVLINVHGSAAFAETNLLQRYWRDANTAARHAGLDAMVGYEVYGKELLGVDERISPMV
ncbi:oxidoreductase [Mycolicibacterium sp. Dal123E01]|uniref:oxidoreductase n=1 Tax=Mycolicibacterium sp. Dal123E01 TaxID=3457578 RepID=UPI00403E5432